MTMKASQTLLLQRRFVLIPKARAVRDCGTLLAMCGNGRFHSGSKETAGECCPGVRGSTFMASPAAPTVAGAIATIGTTLLAIEWWCPWLSFADFCFLDPESCPAASWGVGADRLRSVGRGRSPFPSRAQRGKACCVLRSGLSNITTKERIYRIDGANLLNP
jgi:hypothetical protein